MTTSGTLKGDTCSNCGSVYHVTYEDYPFRDKGAISCNVCGETLLRWNGTRDYSAELVERKCLHERAPDED